jgi:hypothetical protein
MEKFLLAPALTFVVGYPAIAGEYENEEHEGTVTVQPAVQPSTCILDPSIINQVEGDAVKMSRNPPKVSPLTIKGEDFKNHILHLLQIRIEAWESANHPTTKISLTQEIAKVCFPIYWNLIQTYIDLDDQNRQRATQGASRNPFLPPPSCGNFGSDSACTERPHRLLDCQILPRRA